jgi:CIC family chloride channel protein
VSPDNTVHAEARAVDLSQPPVTLALEDDLRKAAELILNSGFRQLPVIGADGEIAGFIEESQVTRVYLNLSNRRA